MGGGSAGGGVVYKIDTSGHETVLYNFTGGSDGANPQSGVVLDSAGNLYGITPGGGSGGVGVIYKIDSTAGHETVLYTFTGICCGFPATDGAAPDGGVTMDSAGNLYRTTAFGGSAGCGTICKLDPTGHETILHNFTDKADGGQVYSGVVLDAMGNLYGTTFAGSHAGVVYKLAPNGQFTTLYSFTGGADGGYPYSGVTLDSAGNLYEPTWSGGNPAADYPGVVYKVDQTGHETALYGFIGTTDGNTARGGVTLDTAGNVYGTTEFGGETCSYPFFGSGVVFEVTPAGQETVLYVFTGGADGSVPEAGVIRDVAGNLCGTTVGGGLAGSGVVYKITPGTTSVAQPAAAFFKAATPRHDARAPGQPPEKPIRQRH